MSTLDRNPETLEESEDDPLVALEAFLSATPLPVGTPEELKQELATMWDRKPWPAP
jgi:hypothetical protein